MIFLSKFTLSSSEQAEVSMVMAGLSGASNGADMPVKFFISPCRAFLYNPLTSLSSQISRGVFT